MLDVGANVGTFALKNAAADARVLAFEPNPGTLGFVELRPGDGYAYYSRHGTGGQRGRTREWIY